MTDKNIKNLLFDFGGVIIRLDQPEALRRFSRLGWKDAVNQLDEYTQKGIFGQLENGDISAEDFRQYLSQQVGRELSYEECEWAVLGYAGEVPQRNLDMLDQLRQEGYKLILISNTNSFMMGWAMSERFTPCGRPLSDFFDALYMSYKEKCMKPSPEIFQHIIDGERIIPEVSLFIDDGMRNVEMAKTMGFNTFCPKNGTDWTQKLREILK